jgi:peptide/nickel transport system substrate-binding protein
MDMTVMISRRRALQSAAALAIATGIGGPARAQAGKNTYLIYATGADASTLDPHFSTDLRTRRVAMQIHETLVARGPDGKFVGVLAESWQTATDGVSWTFKLRKGVKFHDGSDFDAEAVRFSMERLKDPATGSPRRSMGEQIAALEVVDPLTVVIKTPRPYAALLAQLTMENLGIVSPAAAKKHGKDYGRSPAGTGPFKLAYWRPGERIRLDANGDYWGGKAQVRGLEFRVVPEDSARILVLLSGEAHLIDNITPAMLPRLEKAPNAQLITAMSQRTVYFGLNTKMAPFDNPKVRQALAHAIDTRALIKHVMNGKGDVSRSFIDPSILGLPPSMPYEYDPAKSKKLLEEAGFKDGVAFDFYHTLGIYLNDRAVSEAIQAQAAPAGFKISLKTVDFPTHLSMLRARDRAAAYMLSEGSPTADADVSLNLVMKTGGPSNYGNYSNPAVDALIEKQRTQLEPAARNATVAEALKTISEDVPLIPLFYSPQLFAAAKTVDGIAIKRNEFIDFNGARFV